MTHRQFSQVSFKEQCMIIEDVAVLIAERSEDQLRYYLFQLDSFYIEITVQLKCEVVESLESFENQERLKKYLMEIDITGVTQ
ncbi:MAG: hypothetical protein ABIT58_03655 [Ferruginibacter sp.]